MRTCVMASVLALVVASVPARAATSETPLVVTSSNAANNALLVFDATGALVQSVLTQGQGGSSGRAGGRG